VVDGVGDLGQWINHESCQIRYSKFTSTILVLRGQEKTDVYQKRSQLLEDRL
jgi:hypothetical protein